MAEIRWTRESEIWLKGIYDYIALDNPKAAKKVVEGIYRKVDFLSRNPFLGHKYDQHPELDIRIVLYGHYRIVYLLNADKSIDVLGVFHGALDIAKYLF